MPSLSKPSPLQPNPWVAALLTVLLPGSGHLHANRVQRGALVYVISIGIIAIGSFRWMATRSGFYYTFGMAAAWVLVASIDAWNCAKALKSPITAWHARKVFLIPLATFGFIKTLCGFPLDNMGRYRSTLMLYHCMSPEIREGDMCVIDTAWYKHNKVRRMDIIIFEHPEKPSESYGKRCVALAGDIVEFRDNTFYLNGIPQPRRDLLPDGTPPPVPKGGSQFANYGPTLIPEGMIFCLGDNWNESYDSRFWGPLGVHALRGKVLYTYFRWSWVFQISDAGMGR